jgi:hypothetical protein
LLFIVRIEEASSSFTDSGMGERGGTTTAAAAAAPTPVSGGGGDDDDDNNEQEVDADMSGNSRSDGSSDRGRC